MHFVQRGEVTMRTIRAPHRRCSTDAFCNLNGSVAIVLSSFYASKYDKNVFLMQQGLYQLGKYLERIIESIGSEMPRN